jgi:hypothetical protein
MTSYPLCARRESSRKIRERPANPKAIHSEKENHPQKHGNLARFIAAISALEDILK